jgi:hypothetical protein
VHGPVTTAEIPDNRPKCWHRNRVLPSGGTRPPATKIGSHLAPRFGHHKKRIAGESAAEICCDLHFPGRGGWI